MEAAEASHKTHSSYILAVLAASVLVFAVTAFAANITTTSGSAGQGNSVTAGYSMSAVTFGGPWTSTAANGTSYNVSEFAFIIKTAADGTGSSSVTSSNTVVYAQLVTAGGNGNWVLCSVTGSPVAGNTVCSPTGSQQKSLADVTGVNVVARNITDVSPAPAAWAPSDISGLTVWLDASDSATITSSSGAVSQWTDKSSNAYAFTQSTAGAKPTTGTRTQNSKNMLDFDSGDLLAASSGPQLNSMTLFVVEVHDTFGGGTGGRIWSIANTSLDRSVGLVNNAPYTQAYTMTILGSGGGSYDRYTANSSATTGTARYVTFRHTYAIDPTRNIYINGSANDGASPFTATTNPSNTSGYTMRVGNNSGLSVGFDGGIGEMIIYNSALSSTDRATVESYLATKWGL